jgi:diacylglycerol kinase (ATP)
MNAIKHISEKKRFSLIARGRSFTYAVRGLSIIAKTQHNFWIQIVAAFVVLGLGVWLHIAHLEWALLVIVMTAVLVTESINTAFEIDIDLTSPEYHPYAKDTKDVAAGAVLLSVIGAVAVGGIIFIPKILLLL